jgi:hypothetical protein
MKSFVNDSHYTRDSESVVPLFYLVSFELCHNDNDNKWSDYMVSHFIGYLIQYVCTFSQLLGGATQRINSGAVYVDSYAMQFFHINV